MTPADARAYVARRPERHLLPVLAELAGLQRRRVWRRCVRVGLVVRAGGRQHHLVEHARLVLLLPDLWARVEERWGRAA